MYSIKKSLRKNLLERTSKRVKPTIDVEDINIEDAHHDEEITLMLHQINMLNDKVGYLTSINGDLVEFLHTLVKSLDHNNEIDISDARKDFTVLLNRSGRRKFYQQQKRL
tara:strand:- start:176 stop:505 length:330 start_codon:yes stop_codon:yes gene_type:complete